MREERPTPERRKMQQLGFHPQAIEVQELFEMQLVVDLGREHE
jgi:hypothetical protein